MKETGIVVNLSKTPIQIRRIYISYFKKQVIELVEQSQKIIEEIEEKAKNIWDFYFFKIDMTDYSSVLNEVQTDEELRILNDKIENIDSIINLLESVSLHDDMFMCPSEIIMTPDMFKIYDKITKER